MHSQLAHIQWVKMIRRAQLPFGIEWILRARFSSLNWPFSTLEASDFDLLLVLSYFLYLVCVLFGKFPFVPSPWRFEYSPRTLWTRWTPKIKLLIILARNFTKFEIMTLIDVGSKPQYFLPINFQPITSDFKTHFLLSSSHEEHHEHEKTQFSISTLLSPNF